MRQHTVLFACLCSTIAIVSAVPLPASNQELDVLQIPLSNGKELDVLTLGTAEELAERNKRTVGLLRDLFPDITKQSGDGASFDLELLNKQLEETIRVARQANAAAAEGAGADAEQKLTSTNEVQTSSVSNDQQTAESKSPAIDDLSLDSNEDAVDIDDRNKRFLAFGGQANVAGGDPGNKGNSGSFLFDIVRLFGGSVQTQTGDQAANAPSSSSDDSTDSNDTEGSRTADGYSEGIPGPVTRLVVLANRGLANLIQDLILRIAATSERLVNFKARLITALI
ncbi:uncharacterized protein LOC129944291 [Eupeodes corollae]|uniref:uncharacterized protein LOC129944291 n=1 Tax=Eupeodes corollae TaxID=290404 RepID=UPI0024928619|nr:uncharacterized protein LOC129944291 [Eupeodes corollae]